MGDTVRILSIDGGGIRGIVPAVVLARLERLTGRPTAELFDLIAGTSTGGILALGLTRPGEGGRPMYSAEQLIGLYTKEGSRIFASSFWRRVRTAGNLLDERYAAAGIEAVLREYFGEARLRDACAPVLIPTYEIERRLPFFFRSAAARERESHDFPMWQVARAASAAPTYFPPARVAAGESDYWALIDGGVYANNPAACALVEARTLFPGASGYEVVSLGTGSLTSRIPLRKAESWGIAGWARPVLEIVLDGVSATVDYQLRQLLPEGYHRFQVTLQKGSTALDKTDAEFLRELRLRAEALCREREDELERVAEELMEAAGTRLPRAA